MSQIDKELFSGQHKAIESHGDCPQCGQPLEIKHGKSGPFLGCPGYPACHFSKPLVEHESQEVRILAGTECPECGAELALKHGRFGMFVGCSNFPQCHHIEQIDKPDDTHVACPACNKGKLLQRHNRYGKIFYTCDTYPSCKYAINDQPVSQVCPDCGWKILTLRKTSAGSRLICPQKACSYKSERL